MRPLFLSALTVLALGCQAPAEPDEQPIVDVEPDGIDGFELPLDARACGTLGTLCFAVEAPVDPDDTSAGVVVLNAAVVLSEAEEPEGVVFVNFGGFGAPGAAQLAGWAQSVPELQARFHLVSWDPRGSGSSEPLTCAEVQPEVLRLTGPVDDVEDAEDQIAARAVIVDLCREEHGALIDHMSFRDHASDMDRVRQRLGVEQIHYVGYSGGTSLGQAYAGTYGESVGRMVLDSAMPAQGGARALLGYQAPAAAESLAAFDAWCARTDCDIEDARTAIEDVLRHASAGTLRGEQLKPPLSWTDAAYALIALQYSPTANDYLVEALRRGRQGDGQLLVGLSDAYLGSNQQRDVDPWHMVYQLTNCAGELGPTTAEDVVAAEQAYNAYTPLSPIYTTDHAWCAAIGEPLDPMVEPLTADSVDETILVLQSAVDFATPLSAAEQLAEELDARLVVYEGAGHIASMQSACMQQHLLDYLIDGVVPEEGARCVP